MSSNESKSSAALRAKEKAVLAVDIETSGALFTKHGIVSIGWCAGDMNGNILNNDLGKDANWRVCMDPAEVGRTWEERCLREYWNAQDKDGRQPQLEQKKQFLAEAIPTKQAMEKFAKMVDTLDAKYDVTILSDNPGFDIGFLSVYYSEFLGRLPISYKPAVLDPATGFPKHGYRTPTMPREMALKKQIGRMVQNSAEKNDHGGPKQIAKPTITFDNANFLSNLDVLKKKHVHDHNPENDARQIYLTAILLDSSFAA